MAAGTSGASLFPPPSSIKKKIVPSGIITLTVDILYTLAKEYQDLLLETPLTSLTRAINPINTRVPPFSQELFCIFPMVGQIMIRNPRFDDTGNVITTDFPGQTKVTMVFTNEANDKTGQTD